jgi:hypothetical protein
MALVVHEPREAPTPNSPDQSPITLRRRQQFVRLGRHFVSPGYCDSDLMLRML